MFIIEDIFDKGVEDRVGPYYADKSAIGIEWFDQSNDQFIGHHVDIGGGEAEGFGLNRPFIPGSVAGIIPWRREPSGAIDQFTLRGADIDIGEMAGLHGHLQGEHGERILSKSFDRYAIGGGLKDLHLLVQPYLNGIGSFAGDILLLRYDGALHHMLGDPVIDQHCHQDQKSTEEDDGYCLFAVVFHAEPKNGDTFKNNSAVNLNRGAKERWIFAFCRTEKGHAAEETMLQ